MKLTAEQWQIVSDSPLVRAAIKMGCVVVSVELAPESRITPEGQDSAPMSKSHPAVATLPNGRTK